MEIVTVNFLGVPFIALSSQEILQLIDTYIAEKKSLKVCYLTDSQMSQILFSKKAKERILQFDLIIPRSAFLVKLIRSVYPEYPYRDEDNLDLLSPIFKKNRSTTNFMICGGTQIGMNRLSINLQASFIGIKIIGCYSTSFLKARTGDICEMIRKGDVRVLYLGMGTPKDEEWVIQHKDMLTQTISICVNKNLKVLTGEEKEIPYKYRQGGKEATYLLKKNWLRVFCIFQVLFLRYKTFLFRFKLRKEKNKAIH